MLAVVGVEMEVSIFNYNAHQLSFAVPFRNFHDDIVINSYEQN